MEKYLETFDEFLNEEKMSQDEKNIRELLDKARKLRKDAKDFSTKRISEEIILKLTNFLDTFY